MMSEEQLRNWTGPSSATEQDKQVRAEQTIRDAIKAHDAFLPGNEVGVVNWLGQRFELAPGGALAIH